MKTMSSTDARTSIEFRADKTVDASNVSSTLDIEFFRMFARFEYALKKAKYIRARAGMVAAHWDKFANDLGAAFFERVKDETLADTILHSPPNKQAVDGSGELVWQVCKPPENSVALFVAIRRIRNNLFHGGKHENPFNERDRELLSEGIAVLKLALETHDMVKWHYMGNA